MICMSVNRTSIHMYIVTQQHFMRYLFFRSTVNGHKYWSLDFMLYISYKTTFFKKFIVKSFLNGIRSFLHQKEAEIFKDYLFILA